MQALQQGMLEYVVRQLTTGGHTVQPVEKKVIGDHRSRYVKVDGKKGLVLLIDRHFGRADFEQLRSGAREQFEHVAVVFLKDGVTYFRSDARHGHARTRGRSLKHYSAQDANRMLLLRPEEISEWERIRTVDEKTAAERILQYYQPSSERLREGVVTFEFRPVTFDYSHVEEIHLPRRESKRVYEWTDRWERRGALKLEGDFLKAI